ncbi:MAG: PD-(D/E)XK nuclease family protein [Proteobacteria bacterium]|nr:PD-(D/E)XK nuclease family protein [Pseudomonadota bacterium]
MSFAPVRKAELLSRLAEGQAARVTVVTPNRRLAQEFSREFDAGQIAKNLKVWETADILPFSAFVERLYEDALYSDLAAKLPLLLTAAQEQALWESAIRASKWGEALLAVPQAAGNCLRAWELAHSWRIAGALASFPGNDDAKAFAEWSRDYGRRCEREGNTDAARLADVVAPLLKEAALRKPKLLVAYAFDVVTPQEQEFFDACAKHGVEVMSCAPAGRAGVAHRRIFPSAREELDAAAQWARARLEAGAQRIGVVVPELGLRRKEVARVFARTLHPAHNLPGTEKKSLPFNLSLGAPLADYPLVRAALSILELAAGEIPFEQASKLIRSPFIDGAEPEIAKRALLDVVLRKKAPARVTLGKFIGLIEGCPVLRQRLEALFAVPRKDNASPHDWGRQFTALLEALGFPGRSLDSDEYQTRAKFNETLAEFAKLERVAPKMSFRQALASLKQCAEALFQPETPDAPIQVLGFIESLGLEFDALWITGLTDEVWPVRSRLNPFIHPALQRKAGIPEASPEATLERAKRITEGWLHAATEVIVSHPTHEEDRALIGSPLISGVSSLLETPETKSVARYRDAIFAARRIESVTDGQAPALGTKTPKGGTRILSDQAACPFRAFARHRLAAEALEEPVEGLDAMARGSLLHTLMKELWTQLKGSTGLTGDVEPAIERAARAAVAEAELEEPFAALERKRLAMLAREWLEVERQRDPFEVVAMEDKRKLSVAGLELNGRIDRLDKLEAGGHALIDYKTGRPTPNDWLNERPDDPQLPLYALNAAEPISAVAFARLKTGEMRYMGFSDRKDLIPDVKPAKDWAALLEGWKKELEALGSGFASGDARVDPKRLLQTCRYCDLQPLCRVYERVSALGDEGDEE